MLLSMTGFGTGRANADGEELSVEIRAVNHKYCEVKARLPRELSSLELALTRAIKQRLTRGAIDVLVKRHTAASAGVPRVDTALAREYFRALQELAAELRVPQQMAVMDLASQPGVVRLEEREVSLDLATKAMLAAAGQALDSVTQMRRAEGEAIRADLSARLEAVESVAREIAALAPTAVEEYRRRISERVAELAKGVPIEPQRLAQEVAFFGERTDIAEEMTRLASHIEQFRALLASEEPAGRKLEFLVQEMHREINTAGSKSQSSEITSRVVSAKAELERIREQVQNVE